MHLTDEEFVVLKGLQEKFYYFNVSDTKEKLLTFMIYKDQAELISRALIEVIEREIDKRREQDRVKSIIERINEKPVIDLKPLKSCKYELPCGRCDLSKELCSYNYMVKTDGNDI